MSSRSRRLAAMALVFVLAAAGCGSTGDTNGAGSGSGGPSGKSARPGKAQPAEKFEPGTDDLYLLVGDESDIKGYNDCVESHGVLNPNGTCSPTVAVWRKGLCPALGLCLSMFASPATGEAKLKITDNRPEKDFCADRTSRLCRGTTITRAQAGAIAKQQKAATASPRVSEPSPTAPASSTSRPAPSTTRAPKPDTPPASPAPLRVTRP